MANRAEASVFLVFKKAFKQHFLQNLIFLMLKVSDKGGYLAHVYTSSRHACFK